MFTVLPILAVIALFGATAWAIPTSDGASPVGPEGTAVPKLVERLRADPRIKVLAEYADRVSIEIAKANIEKTSVIKEYLRAEQPGTDHAAYMAKSVDQTKGMLYWPLVFASADLPPKYYMVDGEQRATTVPQDGKIIAFVKDWPTIEEAMKDGVSANAARTPPNEMDVLAILSSGKLTAREVADRTGMEETKVGRLNKIAGQRWMWAIVKTGIVGLVMAGKLVDACKGNPDKLAALQYSMADAFNKAFAESQHWTDVINGNPNAKYDAKAKARRQISFYFKGIDWSLWEDALENGRIEQRDGMWYITLTKEAGKKVQGVWIGNDKDWEEDLAFHGMFGSKVEEISTEDLEKYLEPDGYADQIRERIDMILKQRKKTKPSAERPKQNPENEATPDEEPPVTGFEG